MRCLSTRDCGEVHSLLPDNRAMLEEAITNPEKATAQQLRKQADSIRDRLCGPEVHLRGLIEFSNCCRNNCLYCGLRRDNRKVRRYRMTADEIVRTAEVGAELGYPTIVLQSGEDLEFDGATLQGIIRDIKSLGLVVSLSVGERTARDYEQWRSAGAERYLMRHETADPELYRRLHPGQNLAARISKLKILKDLDYQVGTGFMVGLPGQTCETLLADVELAQTLAAEMVGIGPFIPHPDTPLGSSQGGTVEQTCLMVALTRLALPCALLPATTALGSIHPNGREAALQAGANVIMPNLTPRKYRPDYQIYPHKICLEEEPQTCRECVAAKMASIGRTVANGPGHHTLWRKKRKLPE